jgi:hypothetical protein
MSVSPEHYAAFLERIGHRVRQSGGVYWCASQRGVYASFPYHREVDPLSVDLRSILQRDGLVARFGCPLEFGRPSFRIVCDDLDYDFPALRSRTRTQVRRGLEACRVEQLSFADLATRGHALNVDTLQRQGRRVPKGSENYWRRYYAAAAETPGAETWGAFVDGELAAYLISFTMETVANLLILRSSLKHLDVFPNNALVYRFLHERLRSGDVTEVCYGYESIQPGMESLDQFKTGMGFRKVPSGQRVALANWFRPLLNSLTTPLLLRAASAMGGTESSAKLRGLLQWHNEQPPLPDGAKSDRRAA